MKLFEMKHIKKSFDGLEVLKDISLDVEEGEVLSIIGPSGSGKSTFLRSLNRLEIPTGGKIYSRVLTSQHRKPTLTMCVRRSEWYSSSSICFRTKPLRKISCSLR